MNKLILNREQTVMLENGIGKLLAAESVRFIEMTFDEDSVVLIPHIAPIVILLRGKNDGSNTG